MRLWTGPTKLAGRVWFAELAELPCGSVRKQHLFGQLSVLASDVYFEFA